MNEILKFERYFVDKSCIFILYVKINRQKYFLTFLESDKL